MPHNDLGRSGGRGRGTVGCQQFYVWRTGHKVFKVCELVLTNALCIAKRVFYLPSATDSDWLALLYSILRPNIANTRAEPPPHVFQP